MDASERRAFRRRVTAGALGVLMVAVIMLVAVFSEGGLSWVNVGTAAIIIGVLAASTPLYIGITEEFRRVMRRRKP